MKALRSRIYYFDFIRVIAVLLLIMFHFLSGLESYGLLEDPNSFKIGGVSLLNLGGVNLALGNYAFSLFFILAGAVLMFLYQKALNIREFYRKCFIQILPIYYLSYIVCFLLRIIVEQGVEYGAPLWTFILTVFGIDGWMGDIIPNYSLVGDWFVGCILGIHLIFPWLRNCVNKNPKMTIVIASLLFFVWEYFHPVNFPKRYDIVLRAFEVLIGMYFIKLNRSISWKGFGIALLMLGIIFAVRIPYISVYTLMPIAGGSLFVVLSYISRWFDGGNIKSGISFICNYSFTVFLVHHFVLNMIMSKIPQHSIDMIGMLLLFFQCIIVVFGVAIGVQKLKRWIQGGIGYEYVYSLYISKIAMVSIFAIYIFQFTIWAFTQIPSFDGSMNLQVPVSLVKNGLYATTYNGIGLFDTRIQTGTPVLLPIAIVFKIFGIGSTQALMINVFYVALLIFFIYKISAELKVNQTAVLLVMGITTVFSDFRELAMGIYGEIPTLALFLATIYFLLIADRKQAKKYFFVAGLFFGFAYLTKTVILIAVPAIVLVFISKVLIEKRAKIKDICLWIIGAVFPVIIFESYKILQLGVKTYMTFWGRQSDNILKQAGVREGYQDTANLIQKFRLHLEIYSEIFNIQIAALIIILTLNFIWFICKIIKRKKLEYFDIVELVVYSYFGWWLLITPTEKAWGRRIIIGVVLFEWITSIRVLQIFLWGFSSKAKLYENKKRKAIIETVVSVFALLFVAFGTEKCSTDSKKGTMELAEIVKQKAEQENAIFCGRGWYQAPAVSFYSGVSFVDLEQIDLTQQDVPVYFVADTTWISDSGQTERDLPYPVDLSYIESYTGQKLYRIQNSS